MTFIESKAPILPPNPADGWIVIEPLPDGGEVVYTYSEQFNQWMYKVNSRQIQGYIEAEQVLGVAELKQMVVELRGAVEEVKAQMKELQQKQ